MRRMTLLWEREAERIRNEKRLQDNKRRKDMTNEKLYDTNNVSFKYSNDILYSNIHIQIKNQNSNDISINFFEQNLPFIKVWL